MPFLTILPLAFSLLKPPVATWAWTHRPRAGRCPSWPWTRRRPGARPTAAPARHGRTDRSAPPPLEPAPSSLLPFRATPALKLAGTCSGASLHRQESSSAAPPPPCSGGAATTTSSSPSAAVRHSGIPPPRQGGHDRSSTSPSGRFSQAATRLPSGTQTWRERRAGAGAPLRARVRRRRAPRGHGGLPQSSSTAVGGRRKEKAEGSMVNKGITAVRLCMRMHFREPFCGMVKGRSPLLRMAHIQISQLQVKLP
jgi:hypothetical protein